MQMLEYKKIDVAYSIYTNKTRSLLECSICHYWNLFKMKFRSQPKVCDGYNDMILKLMTFNYFGVANVEGNSYRINI